MKHLKKFESLHLREVKFTNKRNPQLEIIVTKSPDGRIVNIENETDICKVLPHYIWKKILEDFEVKLLIKKHRPDMKVQQH